jgi:hypothetical protein
VSITGAERVHLAIGSDKRDLGVGLERPHVGIRQTRREPSHRPLEAQVGIEPEGLLTAICLGFHAPGRNRIGARSVISDDISILRRRARGGRLAGALRLRGRPERSERQAREQG